MFINNIYRIDMIKAIGLDSQYFKSCINVVNNIHLYRIKRPKDKFSLDKQIEFIENIVSSL